MRLHFRAPIGTRIEETEREGRTPRTAHPRHRSSAELSTINSMIGMPTFFNLAFVQTDNIGSQDRKILIALKPGHAPTEAYMDRIRRELPDEFPGSTLYFQPPTSSARCSLRVSAPSTCRSTGRRRGQLRVGAQLAQKIAAFRRERRRIPQVLAHSRRWPSTSTGARRTSASPSATWRYNLLVSLSSSTLVAPSFWINPRTT